MYQYDVIPMQPTFSFSNFMPPPIQINKATQDMIHVVLLINNNASPMYQYDAIPIKPTFSFSNLLSPPIQINKNERNPRNRMTVCQQGMNQKQPGIVDTEWLINGSGEPIKRSEEPMPHTSETMSMLHTTDTTMTPKPSVPLELNN